MSNVLEVNQYRSFKKQSKVSSAGISGRIYSPNPEDFPKKSVPYYESISNSNEDIEKYFLKFFKDNVKHEKNPIILHKSIMSIESQKILVLVRKFIKNLHNELQYKDEIINYLNGMYTEAEMDLVEEKFATELREFNSSDIDDISLIKQFLKDVIDVDEYDIADYLGVEL